MGAYLSTPNRDKNSVDYEGKLYSYGASSMQGWRMSQEDAHNCCEDFDDDTALFAVYDGHGGSEVAQYTAQEFPAFIKGLDIYKEGKLSQALEDAFLSFDESLTKEAVIHKLREIAGIPEDDQTQEDKEEEVAELFEEADMPLDKLLERYKGAGTKGKEYNPSPALRGKGDSDKINKTDSIDIKTNLQDKLLNGSDQNMDCSGDKKRALNENEAKSEVINGDQEQANTSSPKKALFKGDSESCEENQNQEHKVDKVTSLEEKKSETQNISSTSSNSVDDANDIKVSTKNGVNTEVKGSDNNSEATPVHKTPANSSTSASNSSNVNGPYVSQKATENSSDNIKASNSEDEVSSSSEQKSDKTGDRSDTSADVSQSGSALDTPTSTHSVETSSSSFQKDSEPSSSSGRVRPRRSGVIPAEGEDESSAEETSSEEAESGSDDSEDYEEFAEGDSEEDDSEELDEEDMLYPNPHLMYGGGQEEPGSDSGCTAVVALVRGNELYVANAGDSRCVVSRNGVAMDMSVDHKPEDALELQRIEAAGGQVTADGRVNGGLNLSRALGDHAYKKTSEKPLKDQMITPLPDVRTLTLSEQDEFMILACDGIWNSLSSQDTVNFVRDRLKEDRKLSSICEEMFEFILAPDTNGDGTGCDNMTCVIVKFSDSLRQSKEKTDHGATKRLASQLSPETSADVKSSESAPEDQPIDNESKRLKQHD